MKKVGIKYSMFHPISLLANNIGAILAQHCGINVAVLQYWPMLAQC